MGLFHRRRPAADRAPAASASGPAEGEVPESIAEAQHSAEVAADRAEDAADQAQGSAVQAEAAADVVVAAAAPGQPDLGTPGAPLAHSPFYIGLLGGLGFAVAIWLGQRVLAVGSVLILVVVAMFLAAGLNPAVEVLVRRGFHRALSVLVVCILAVAALALFLVAIVPVVTDQVSALVANVPGYLDQLQHNQQIEDLNQKYDLIDKLQDYITSGELASQAFGGVLTVGIAVLSALGNAFVVIVLTLYFLASLPTIKKAAYHLAPASRRDRVTKLGDQIIRGVGGYVSGAFLVALAAGLSSLVFLFFAGLKQYAVALAIVVALLDVIPMIGATLGAVVVCAIGFATSPGTGIACVIFFLAYQQIENYLIYPRVMSRSVDVPGSVTVIAALVGAGLLGVVGALLAIPTAAAILLLTREVFVRRQDAR